jgi:hypothetical protein
MPSPRVSTAPVLVTGLPRSGTSWVGKMLELSGSVVYVNEPLNPSHPPGRSPGVLDAQVEHYFQYICSDNSDAWLPAFRRTAALRFGVRAELGRNRGPYDMARAARNLALFSAGRIRGRRALLDDPYAVLSVAWMADRLGAATVVLVRDPVAFVGSWRTLGWSVDPAELLAQPLLMRDHLEPFREELERLKGSTDAVATACLLWRATYTVVHAVAADRPAIKVCRHEDLATHPVAGFRGLYDHAGLVWSPAVEQAVAAATTATPQRGPAKVDKGFRWSLRGGLSRTAFRPMDSTAALSSYRARLSQAEIERVLELTSDVRPLYYDSAPS